MSDYAKQGKHFGSIAKRSRTCECGKKGKYGVWGKYYCRDCFIKKLGKDPDQIAEEHGKGNSGMLPFKSETQLKSELNQTFFMPESFKYPCLLQVPKGNKLFASLYLTHYPNSKGIVGRSINYLVIWNGRVVGIIGGNSAPYSVKAIDEFFEITKENRSDNPHDEAPLIQEFHIEADNDGNVMVSESTFDSPDIESVLSCVVCFVKTWWKKYKQRVKLTFEIKHQKQSLDLAEKGKLEIANQFTFEERHDIISMLTDTFMKYGEYCMARLLAENLFQRTIGSATKKTWSQEEKINLVTQMRREAKNISYIHGTLLYIQPNLKLYGLREWRNDGDQPKSLPPPP